MVLPLAAGAMPVFLPQVVVIVLAAAGVAYVCQRIGLVPIVGFLLAGVLVGPNALGLVRDPTLIDAAAEIGVLLLLFTIGIEFSMETLTRIRRLILVGGGVQVGLTTALVAGALAAFGVGWGVGVYSGFLVALSSTAIVTKLLADRGATGSATGEAAVGLLVFQDIAILAMVLLIPALAGGAGGGAVAIAMALGKAIALVAVGLVVARRVLPPVLEHVARTCSPELFLLTVVAICLGTAALVGLAGVSLSLGAFLAGLVVSQSRFSEHALSEILPLQILFSATFFVSIGLLLDVPFMVAHLPLVGAVVAGVLLVKVVATVCAVRAVGRATPVAVAAALWLAQVGEFSFVLERAGAAAGLTPFGLGADGSQVFIAATVVLMALTPALGGVATRLSRRLAERPDATADTPVEALHHLSDHVIVAGYGEAARPLVDALTRAGVPVAVVTLSPAGAAEVQAAGGPVLLGDYTKRHILEAAGLARARALVVPDDTPEMAHRAVAVARALRADVPVVASAPTAALARALVEAGATAAPATSVERTTGLLAPLLDLLGVPDAATHLGGLRDRARDAAPAPLLSRPMRQRADWIDLTQPLHLDVPDGAGCTHAGHVHDVVPGTPGCAECLRTGDRWVHLRICMTCGHVGCCDSSPGRHATAHFHETGHPVARSVEPGETWGWCYVDEVRLE